MESKSQYTISVIMAVYNCQDTLAASLDSLLGQTYQKFKIILCDDCSSDKTLEVASSYAKRYPEKFIILKNNNNLKLPASLNKCLKFVDTEYVARMDGDDISKPDRFEKEINFLENNPEYALVSCPMEYFNENGIYRKGRCTDSCPTKFSFLKATPFCHAPVMVRTSVLKEVEGYTVAKWTERGQDYHLWAKIYNKGYRGYNLNEPLYLMRDDENAIKRRSVKVRLYAIKRNYKVHKLLDLPKRYRFYILSPILRILAPNFIYRYFHYLKHYK